MQIGNSCSKLPFGARLHVRTCLRWINPADLAGVGSIELQDSMPKATKDSPDWHKQATADELSINGLYIHGSGISPARITLFTRDIYRGIPKLYWLTPVTTLSFARTLAHEVGHHLIAERGYVFTVGEKTHLPEYEEEMAHRYSSSVLKRMRQRCYYRLAHRAMRDLALTHYMLGVHEWNAGRYRKAAEDWYKAFHLDSDRQDAIDWYLRARQRLVGDVHDMSECRGSFLRRSSNSH